MGELLSELGLIEDVTIQRALEIKAIIGGSAGVDPSIGQIFRSVGQLSMVDFFQVLAIQVGLSFDGLDDSAPAIFRAAMDRHVKP